MREFEAGDCIVYPTHGVARIDSVDTLTMGGMSCRCYRMRILASGTVAVVPVANAASIGLRPTIARGAIEAILARLHVTDDEHAGNWKDRFHENSNRLKSGRLEDAADVLRTLARLAAVRPLSYRDRSMLDRVREQLIAELAIGAGSGEQAMGVRVDEALRGPGAA